MKVQLNKSNNNPFCGLKECLKLFQNVTNTITYEMLNKAYEEVKDNREHKEMFYSLCFSIGDITTRQHNLFKGIKRDSGGNANREGFYTFINWLRDNHYDQFIKFLYAGLFNEYSCFDMLFRCRVQTKGAKVIKVYNMFDNEEYCKDLSNYVYKIVNGNNNFNKLLVAKFLTIPRMSKRQGHKKMLAETTKVMSSKALFLTKLSKLCNWEIRKISPININFVGYRKWRQKYNQDLESVIFSTKRHQFFDESSFIKWFDTLPAQARFRVKNRILYSVNQKENAESDPKYPTLQKWYANWEEYKTKKQEEQRILEEKIRQNQATEEDKTKLEKIKKQAKVTVGATSFKDIYEDSLLGKLDELKVESFMNKVNLPYNNLVIIDDSGSMNGAPFNFATFLASVCLVKNPDDDGRNLVGMFNSRARFYGYIDKEAKDTTNSILRRTVSRSIVKPLVDPKLSFVENYNNIRRFLNANFYGGGTNVDSIARYLREMSIQHPEVLDSLKNYPIWTICSDGDFNNSYSPEASINDLKKLCKQLLGFEPFIVVIEVLRYEYATNIIRFAEIDNFMYLPANPATIEQFLTNFKDMDVFDVYTPLQSIYRSNRYSEVRNCVL